MKVKFWGVRGSIPCPGPKTVKYGGNTTCIEIRASSDRLFIVDAGTGIRALGEQLLRTDIKNGLRELDIFLSHTHWDHILGFPFFGPMYIPGMTIRIHGPVTFEQDSLEKVLKGQFEYRYFPVRVEELASKVRFIELGEDVFDLGDGIRLTTKYLNHPISCMGYRFEGQGKSVATVFDTEPYQNLFALDSMNPAYDPHVAAEAEEAVTEQNRLVESFYAGADLVIHDAQYTCQEYASKIGWGHYPMEDAIATCRRNGVKRLALMHHDPDRTDAQLDALAQGFNAADGPDGTDAFFAREGMALEL
jgi:phosphoribosyl 1,2-cyclic phosphodiesterase